jgi:hypothetical protein
MMGGRRETISIIAKIHLAMLLSECPGKEAHKEALALAQELKQLRGISPGHLGWAWLIIGRVQLQEDEFMLAEASARSALENLRVAPYRRVLALALLIESQVGQGKLLEANEAAAEGQALIARLGGTAGYAALPFGLALAVLKRRSGDIAASAEILTEALRELFRRASRSPDDEAHERFLTQIREHNRLVALCREWRALASDWQGPLMF